MKKALFFLLTALFAVGFIAKAQTSTCPITIELYETGSEGWEANRLCVEYVNADNETVTEQFYVVSGQTSSSVIDVADGTTINMYLTGSGSTTFKKRSFKLLYNNGIVLYTSPILKDGYSDVIENFDCSAAEREYRIITLLSNYTDAGVLRCGGEETNPTNVNNFTNVILSATANSGYVFENWTINGIVQSTSSSYDLYADGDYTLTANFIPVDGLYVGDYGNNISDVLPSNTNVEYTISQQIYTADELEPGVITGMKLFNAQEGRTTRSFAIYVQTTSKNTYEATDDWIALDDAIMVYDDDVDMSYAHWYNIPFDESIVLGGNENLCITVFDYTEDIAEDDEQYNCRVYNTTPYNQALIKTGEELDIDDIESYDGELMSQKNQIVLDYSDYFVTVTANNDTYGSVNGGGEYASGESCTVIATANPGYDFVNWTVNGVAMSTDDHYTFTVNRSVNVVANFEVHEITNHWVCEDSNLFPDFVSMVAVVNIDGEAQNNTMLEVGAFNGDIVRGSGFVAQYGSRYRVFISLYGNVGHDITFKLYDHSLSMERDDLRCEEVFHIESLPSSEGTMANPHVLEFDSRYDITATVNPEGVGTVTGTGSYFLNEQVTLTATSIVGNYVFRNWELNGDVVSTANPYTFPVTGDMAFVANFDYQETTTIPSGYSWWSTAVETNANSLTMLENGLTDKGVEIRAQNGRFVQYEEGEWYGTLTSINNESSYTIRTNDSCNVVMTGQKAEPASHPITINKSVNSQDAYTWIGYPVSGQQSVTTAFATFTPVDDEQVWRKDGAIAYYYDNEWYINNPSMNNTFMTTGLGYKYLSKDNQDRTLTYSTPSRGDDNGNEVMVNYYWNTNYYAYPENMSLITTVSVEDVEQRDENLELGAFVNGESRGQTKLMYVNGRYYAMLMITGNEGDKVEFGLVDAANNRISLDCLNEITFGSNTSIGSFDKPFEVAFEEMVDINRSNLNLYPNPVDRNMSFTLNVPVDETIKDVVISNALGEVVRNNTSTMRIEEGLHVAGMYMVKVICNSGNVYNGKLIVK